MQMSQDQTAPPLTRRKGTRGNYPFSHLFIRGDGSLCFHSLLAFTHRMHRQQELCPLAPGFCSTELGIFQAEGRCKLPPPDIKAEAPTLTAAFCSTVTAVMSGGDDKTYPTGLFCSPVPPEAFNHRKKKHCCCLCGQGRAGTERRAAAHSEGRNRIPLPWLSVRCRLPFASHSPPPNHQTGTSSVTFPVIAFLAPEACRAP